MAHSVISKSTLKETEILSKKLIRFGILTIVCSDTDDDCQTSGEKIQYTHIMNDLFTNDIIKDLEKASRFNTKITQQTVDINNHTIMEKICIWCDKSEVDIILITGLPCNAYFDRTCYFPNDIKEMVTKTFENIIDKHDFKKYARTGPEIKEKLESEYNRVMCGERNGKLIINLFDTFESAFNCINIITTTLKDEIILEYNQKVEQAIASWLSLSSSDQENGMNKANLKESSSLGDAAIKQLNDKKDAFDVKSFLFDQIKNLPNRLKHCINFHLFHEDTKMELEDIIPNTQYDMITIEKAISFIRETVALNIEEEYEKVDIKLAFGRILCEPINSKCNVPAFKISTKHGYAVLESENEGMKIVLNKTTSDPISLSPGTCVWVKSGDRIPDEATAVVKVKDVKRVVSHEATNNLIMIKIKPEYGQNIKNVGRDIPKDKLILTPHICLGPAEIGLLAATGWETVLVAKRISVGVLSIGDLLEDPVNFLKPGYVYDSSRISLVGLLKEKRFMLNNISDFGNVTENEASILDEINDALKRVNVLVIIGCVNDHDVLKTVLRDHLGASIHFGNVNMKPGKSTTFATYKVENKTKYLLCLSGNPASILISAQIFLIPLLDALCHKSEDRQKVPVCINQQYTLHPRSRVAWSSLQWNLHEKTFASAFGKENDINDKLFSCQGANALLMLPPRTVKKMIGSPALVSALPLDPN